MTFWAFKRMAIIYSIILTVMGLILGSLYYFIFIDVEATCFDSKLNQDEVNVDCGGICGGACIIPDKNGLALWNRSFKISDGIYSLGAYTETSVAEFKAYDVPFEIELYDEFGDYINRHKGTVDLYPGVANPIFIPRVDVGSRNVEQTQFRFTDVPRWQPHNADDVIELKVSKENINLELDRPRVDAEIENVDVRQANRIIAYATVFDQRGNAIAMTQTFINSLKPGAKKNISFNWASDFTLIKEACEKDVGFWGYSFADTDLAREYLQFFQPDNLGRGLKLTAYDVSHINSIDVAGVKVFSAGIDQSDILRPIENDIEIEEQEEIEEDLVAEIEIEEDLVAEIEIEEEIEIDEGVPEGDEETENAASSPDEIVNCGALSSEIEGSFDCFMDRIAKCDYTTATFDDTEFISEFDITLSTKSYKEIQGADDGECIIYNRIDTQSFTYTDKKRQALLTDGMTETNIDELLLRESAPYSIAPTTSQTCRYEADDLSAVLDEKQQITFLTSNDDLRAHRCDDGGTSLLEIDDTSIFKLPDNKAGSIERQIVIVLDENVDESLLLLFDKIAKENNLTYIAILLPAKDTEKQDYIRTILPKGRTITEFSKETARRVYREVSADRCDVSISKVEVITKADR